MTVELTTKELRILALAMLQYSKDYHNCPEEKEINVLFEKVKNIHFVELVKQDA